MSAIRLPLLCAFAGGCLSSAVLFGLWRTGGAADAATAKQSLRAPRVVQRMTATTAAPGLAASSKAVAADASGNEPQVTAPATTPVTQELDGASPTPAGSAVADVLMQLEAAYRERVSAQTPAPASTSAPAPAPAQVATAALAPSQGASAQGVAAVPVIPTPAAPAARAVAPDLQAAAAPVAVAAGPQVGATRTVVAQYTPPPTQVHYGDVNQNTYITNVRQSDMYQMQMQMQMQQIAMLQYIQLIGMSSALAAPVRSVGVASPQRGTLNTGITNPDNPWGFQFSPPNLVR